MSDKLKKFVEVDINNLVRVKLKPEMKKFYVEYEKERNKKYCNKTELKNILKEASKDEIEIQLWKLMEIFGPKISISAIPPFEKNIIKININKEI